MCTMEWKEVNPEQNKDLVRCKTDVKIQRNRKRNI
jgi:hypothetical protein